LSIITDAYSRKIVGYCLQESLHATGCAFLKLLCDSVSTESQ
jgi:hypothetical protein